MMAMLVIAPLRGWYSHELFVVRNEGILAPLRGWYTKYITKHRKTEESDG